MPSDLEHGRSGLNLQLPMRKQVPVSVLAIIASVSLFFVYLSRDFSPDLNLTAEEAVADEKVQREVRHTALLHGVRLLVETEVGKTGNADDGQIEFVYQTPEGYNASLQTKALLFMAHGCNHAATDMFDRSDSCRECIGLPVEKGIVRAALQKGFAVLAVSSTSRFICGLSLAAVLRSF